MSASKHTPGPWKIVKSKFGDLSIKSEVEANARLIAAAPELLEACKRAFDQTDKDARPADWEMLRAAIAKATGA